MDKKGCIQQTGKFIQEQLKPDPTGHDFAHSLRVARHADLIARSLGADRFITALAALLHDVEDWKFHAGTGKVRRHLKTLALPENTIHRVEQVIAEVSFKGAGVKTMPSTPEGRAVQDADRLDALGAIGIARAFAYGGFKKRLIYDPQVKPRKHQTFAQYRKGGGHTIGHFYEKLLLLKGRMNTPMGRKMAKERHAFLAEFLARFLKEWG